VIASHRAKKISRASMLIPEKLFLQRRSSSFIARRVKRFRACVVASRD